MARSPKGDVAIPIIILADDGDCRASPDFIGGWLAMTVDM
jgi:hypothetical protein